jgi:BirA family transcriptional regulator, biotin operon repressor / biotin---[acetyl-CoA-carboxylase] ligase
MHIGNKVQILASCQSTNQYLRERFTYGIQDGELVCARSQTAGRGQRGNTWESEDNMNLTFSFYVELKKVLVTDQFTLNYFVSLGILAFLERFLPEKKEILLKWPNDIYYKDKKIAGILIENQVKDAFLSNSIVGIGLNLNQSTFKELNATSVFIETNEDYVVEEALGMLLNSLNKFYSRFMNDEIEALKNEYLDHLLGFQKVREYIDLGTNEVFVGRIIDVKSNGLIEVLVDEELRLFGLKEIKFLF